MKYARTIHTDAMPNFMTGLAVSANIGMLAVIYTFLGSLISYVFYYIFDDYDPENGERKWDRRSTLYQVADVVVEILIISILSFWFSFLLNRHFPIIPVKAQYASYIDTYSTGLFFMFTIFLFVTSFGNKLEHLFGSHVAPYFDVWFPQEGSLLTFSLRYRKKNDNTKQAS
jgi:hypothetical protein